jgi:serine/threonine protein kinase
VTIQAKIANPHVVQLLGACTTGELSDWCLVTEYCARGDLRHILDSHKSHKLNLNKKFSFAIDTCLGLAWLNGPEVTMRFLSSKMFQVAVVHRDLKPDNSTFPKMFALAPNHH